MLVSISAIKFETIESATIAQSTFFDNLKYFLKDNNNS